MRYGMEFRFNNVCKQCSRPFSVLAKVVKPPSPIPFGWDDYIAYEDVKTGKVYGGWKSDHNQLYYTCACGKTKLAKSVRGKYNAGKECSPKCQGATGHQCECRCAGKNHGAAFG